MIARSRTSHSRRQRRHVPRQALLPVPRQPRHCGAPGRRGLYPQHPGASGACVGVGVCVGGGMVGVLVFWPSAAGSRRCRSPRPRAAAPPPSSPRDRAVRSALMLFICLLAAVAPCPSKVFVLRHLLRFAAAVLRFSEPLSVYSHCSFVLEDVDCHSSSFTLCRSLSLSLSLPFDLSCLPPSLLVSRNMLRRALAGLPDLGLDNAGHWFAAFLPALRSQPVAHSSLMRTKSRWSDKRRCPRFSRSREEFKFHCVCTVAAACLQAEKKDPTPYKPRPLIASAAYPVLACGGVGLCRCWKRAGCGVLPGHPATRIPNTALS
jgi:hypothetical protein